MNLSLQIFKVKSALAYKKIISYYFFKNNIKVIISLNFNNFKFLNILSKLKLYKVGLINNYNFANYYHYYLLVPYININIQTYLYSYIVNLYINYLTKKYTNFKHYYFSQINKDIMKI